MIYAREGISYYIWLSPTSLSSSLVNQWGRLIRRKFPSSSGKLLALGPSSGSGMPSLITSSPPGFLISDGVCKRSSKLNSCSSSPTSF
ncbi:hypothetical protein ACFX1R_045521 [Malus domestica]